MCAKLGGPAVGELARRRFIEGDTSPELLRAWLETVVPLYVRKPQDPDAMKRIVFNVAATAWFNRPGGDGRTFDFLPLLERIQCPTLVLGGELDPMMPIECQRDIAAAIRPDLLSYRAFPDCGHGVVPDAPEEAMALMRDFIQSSFRRDAATAA